MENQSPAMLSVSPSPHFHSGESTAVIMQDVLIALVPATLMAVVYFGWRTVLLLGVCVGSCVLAEYLCRRAMNRPQTIGDFSAAVTGVLLAFNLPPTIHPLLAVLGCVFAIVVVKQMFGGIGMNFVNPAIAARVFLLISFPSQMSRWSIPFFYLSRNADTDAVSSATPLAQMATGTVNVSYMDLFIGMRGGCVGETCVLALLLGGSYLLLRRVITPEIPLCFLGTVAVISLLAGQNPLLHLMTGGVMLGAIFMATDYTTCPVNRAGKVIYGVGCGVITMTIRLFGALPEGVSYAILLMNILTPHIETLTQSAPFGKEAA
ncbi:MAG: RnfABCDGE type electron transport complex subunit D [Clostridia bacterium]|nr:RnfABCDGE type electron transport complex subunit D [Clostridia bacterium]